MMMETIAAVIPHDVYSYVHACDDGVDVSVDTSTEGDFSPDPHSENSQYCLEQRALVAGLHNGTAEPDQQASCSLGYQDPNAAGDIEQTPDATAHEGSSEEAAFPEENVIFYTEDHQPCVWDATLNAYVLVDPDSITNHVPHQEATDGEPVEAVELEAGVEYTEAFAGGEPETVYADPTQMNGQENVPAESAQEHGYQDEYGNFVYYEQAPLGGGTETGYSDPTQVQGEENGFVPADSTEVQGNYEENANIVYNEQAPEGNEEAQYDPAQYAEEQPAEGNVHLGADGVQNAQVEGYAEEEYTGAYAAAENSGALFPPEALEPVPETQVPEMSPETASAELAYTPEEHQRDLDAAFFCGEGGHQPPPQVTEGFAVQGSQDLAQAHADQSQHEVQAAEEAMSTIGTAECIEQEVAQEHAYDPSASAPAVCSQEPCADQAALTGYHGEVAQGYGAEAVEFQGGEASQAYCAGPSFGDYQEQAELEPQQYSEQVDGEQYQHYEQAEVTAEYAPQHFAAESVVHEETYAQPFEEADCTANAAYPVEEAVYHYETATPLDAELVQDQIDAQAQLEYVGGAEQYCEQQPVVADGVVYHAAYGAGVDPSQLGYYEEQQFPAENTEQHDFGVYEVEEATLADQTYDPAAIDVQQYSEVLGDVSAGEGDAQAAQSLAQQELISEAGTATQGTDQGYVDNHVAEQQHVQGVEPYTEGHDQQSALEYTEQDLQESSEQYPGEGVEQYSLLQEQQYPQEYTEQDPEERYAAEGAEHNSADHVEQFPQEYAVQDASAYQGSQECAEQQAAEYAAQYPAECVGRAESQAYIEAGDFSQQNGGLPLGIPTEACTGEVCASRNEVVSPHIVRGKPFTREMDSTEKFKNFRIEYERTPAFDAFGHCLRFLGVRRGFVCSIRADGVVCIQLKGSQQDEWQDTEFEYDASKPAAKVEVGNMYVIEHSFDGNKYLERCRVTNVENGMASIHLLDTGCERDIPEHQLHDIVNLEEVERLPPQVVEIFVVGLTNEGYSKEDLERLENDWNSYEEVFIIPVDAPKDGLIRTIVSRKNGETLGIRTPPQNMNKIV